MNKLIAALAAMRKGSMLADPALWKNRAAAIVAITAVIDALVNVAHAWGYDVPITPELADGIAVSVVTLVSLYFTFATSDKVGFGSGEAPADPGATNEVPAGRGTDADPRSHVPPGGP